MTGPGIQPVDGSGAQAPAGAVRDVTHGPVRLIQGDCLQLMSQLGPVDHFISDPPYEEIMHASKNSGAKLRRDDGTELQGLNFASIDAIRAEVVAQGGAAASGWFIAFCTFEGVGRWADTINASPMRYKRACGWVKPDSPPQFNGQCPASWGEAFVAAWAGKGHAKWNGGGKRGVYTHLQGGRGRTGGHPTEKPVALMRDIILDFTQPGQLILDPFAGSGTTLVAAIQTGRRAIGIELDRQYFELAERRVLAALAAIRAGGVQLTAHTQEAFL